MKISDFIAHLEVNGLDHARDSSRQLGDVTIAPTARETAMPASGLAPARVAYAVHTRLMYYVVHKIMHIQSLLTRRQHTGASMDFVISSNM